MRWSPTKTNKSAILLLQNVYGNVIDALYPRRCPICDAVVSQSMLTDVGGRDGRDLANYRNYANYICRQCSYTLKYAVENCCMVCGKPMDSEERERCSDCGKKEHLYDRGVAAFSYTDEIKKSIYRFKYNNRREYAKSYADILCRLKGDIIKSWKPDMFIPVPLYESKQKSRGYNQAGLIADELSKRLHVPVREDILVRIRNTRPMKELDDKERNNNIKNAFQIRNNDVKCKKIVLVDDIYTTGLTIDECAGVLKEAGAGNVYYASVCIGRGF